VARPRTDTGQTLLGLALRERRLTHDLTLRALSERSGLSTHTLVSVEMGRRLPSLLTLDALAQVYGTTAQDLLEGVYPWSRSGEQPPP
jgi:transcriptional regulator with XRE-family HTH domain